MSPPAVGTTAEYRHVIRPQDLAVSWENDLPVLATPVLLWLAERASMQILDRALADGEMSVGYAHHEARHLAVTPLGWEITMTATLESIDSSRASFRVVGHDGHDVVYQGIHVRAVVQRDRLLRRLEDKASRQPATDKANRQQATEKVGQRPATENVANPAAPGIQAQAHASQPPATVRHTPRSAFSWLWASAAGATLADGIYQVALPIAALAAGGGATGVAAVYTATRAPWALFALFAGALVDRFDRRRLLVIANIVRTTMLLIGVIVTTTHVGGIAALAAAAFILGTAETIGDTAMHSITPRIVSGAGLERANGRMQSTELLTNLLIGPSIGGLLAGIAIGCAFGGVALLYAMSALSAAQLLRLTIADTRPAGQQAIRVRDGLSFLLKRRTLLVYAIGVGVVNAGFAAFQTALPLVALRPGPLGLTPAGYGLLIGVAGVSGTITALLAPRLIRAVGNRATLLLGQLGLGTGFALAGLLHTVPAVVCAVAATGTVVLGSIVTVCYRQRTVPDALLGRVTAAYRLLAFGGLPLGSALAGIGAHVLTPRSVLVIAGVVALAAGAAMAWVSPSRREEARP
jgi:predicted thioesterase/MFS family permease